MARLRPARWLWLLRLPRAAPASAESVGWAWAFLALPLALAAWGAGAAYTAVARDLPPVETLETWLAPEDGLFWQPTRVYAADGTLWYPAANATAPRPYWPLAQMPEPVVQTTLAALDPDFWQHDGIRGPWWRASGPPTLAQRLVTRFVLADRAHDPRAAWQARLLAQQATARYGRGRMLAWFLNSAAYGPGVYGIADAATAYFGKTPAELTWAEAAWLAVVLREAPPDPVAMAESLQPAARALLHDLVAQGRAPQTVLQEPPARPRAPQTTMPAAVRALFDALQRTLPAWPAVRRGLQVQSTVEPDLMAQAACLAQALRTLQPGPCDAELALYRLRQPLTGVRMHLVALDPRQGAVLAWYATPPDAPAEVPVGSFIAPWVYAVAFSRGWGPATMLWDLPQRVPLGLEVRNHDGRFHGPLRARMALANAYEVPLADLLAQLDPRTVWPTVRRLGLRGWPTALAWEPLQGEVALAPLAAAHGLSPFATLGRQTGLPQPLAADLLPTWWQTVRFADGRALPTAPQPETRSLLAPELAYLVTHVLQDGPAHRPTLGVGDPLRAVEPAAVAVGRSPDGRAAWVAVWSPERIALVALDAREAAVEPDALALAARVLARAWWATVQPQTPPDWPRPPEVVQVPVCDPSGLLPTADCPNVVVEVFLQNRVPTQPDPYYRRLRIHRPSGLLATVFTPPQEVEERVFFLWPPEARSWAQGQGLPVPPQAYAPLVPPTPAPDLALTEPGMFAYVRGQVALRGVVAGEARQYRIQVGQGPAPQRWITVAQGRAPAQGTLGVWDTTGLNGLYTVQLMAIDADDRVRTFNLLVSIDPKPPRVVVRSPQTAARYCLGPACPEAWSGALPIDIRAEDDLALAEVRAWMDGALLARWVQGPFHLAWEPTPGAHTLRVEARDRAGNTTRVTIPFTVEERP